MKFGLIIGREFKGNGKLIYRSLINNDLTPNFILYAIPTYKRIISNKDYKWYYRYPAAFVFKTFPIQLIRILLKSYFPKLGKKCYYVKDVNSKSSISIMIKENPDYIILYSCGYITKRTCELFHNKMISAHAGKLPEYRGISNVEWAYFENDDLYATFQFTAPSMDTGEIVYEKRIDKISNPRSIDQIREEAFSQLYKMYPNVLMEVSRIGFSPIKQRLVRTNRYKMHPFLVTVLKIKLGMTTNKNLILILIILLIGHIELLNY